MLALIWSLGHSSAWWASPSGYRHFTHRSFQALAHSSLPWNCRTPEPLETETGLLHIATPSLCRLHHDPHSPLKLMNMEMELQQSPEVIFLGSLVLASHGRSEYWQNQWDERIRAQKRICLYKPLRADLQLKQLGWNLKIDPKIKTIQSCASLINTPLSGLFQSVHRRPIDYLRAIDQMIYLNPPIQTGSSHYSRPRLGLPCPRFPCTRND